MISETKMQEIARRYDELPEDVQKALFSTKTSDAIFEIGKKHELAIDKMGELADETGLVMLGMTKPSEYIRNLEKRLGIEVTKAKEIAEDINQKVFSPIRESLKKIHGITAPTPVETPRKISRELTPENLPIETTPIPKKIVMPPRPADIKVGEIAKEIEPKVEVKPSLSGRMPADLPADSARQALQAGSSAGFVGEAVPDIFLKKIPTEKPKVVPDFSPPSKESAPQGPKEVKNMLEKELAPNQPTPAKPLNYTNSDPYREPIQ